MKHVISISDFSRKQLDNVLSEAKKMNSALKKGRPLTVMNGKVMAALFFEPSTRTRLSFETAMNRLGGKVIGFAQPGGTSLKKKETMADTILTVAGYADVIVMRHPLPGSARLASEVSPVPIINGGDGSNQHPTQTMLDLFTIKQELGRLDGLNVALVGDLKYGRTVHSLCTALQKYKNTEFKFVSPPELKIPSQYKKGKYSETEELDLQGADVVYVTRIQEERFSDRTEYEKLKGVYRITPETLESLKKKSIVMHPLPRVDEIDWKCDKDKRCVYFKQSAYGVPTRMGLIKLVMGGKL
jgi:aspartate carbamoyltransferase catalytic subunit